MPKTTTAGFVESVSPHQANFLWILRLRWLAVVGQSLAVFSAYSGLGVVLPMSILMIILCFAWLSNVWLHVWFKCKRLAISEHILAAVVLFDIGLLTLLLYWTGGSNNPFSFLYLLDIAMAAVMFGMFWTCSITGLCIAGFASVMHRSAPLLGHGPHDELPASVYRFGHLTAFTLLALLLAYFVRQMTNTFREQEHQLRRQREVIGRNEKLASLATLAAGAAHELATPLATIAIVAKEMELQLQQSFEKPNSLDHTVVSLQQTWLQDTQLIRQEVGRCRDVLQQMSFQAGACSGEEFHCCSWRTLLQNAQQKLRDKHRLTVHIPEHLADNSFKGPVVSLTRCIRAVLKNALEASCQNSVAMVEVTLSYSEKFYILTVQDYGIGMPQDILKHAGEPFFTTKPTGAGMGLGLFLCHSLLQQLGGSMELQSQPGQGTQVRLNIPEASC